MGATTRGLERVPEVNFVVAVTKVMAVQQYTPSPWKRHVSPLSAPSHSPSFVHHTNILFGVQKIKSQKCDFFGSPLTPSWAQMSFSGPDERIPSVYALLLM